MSAFHWNLALKFRKITAYSRCTLDFEAIAKIPSRLNSFKTDHFQTGDLSILFVTKFLAILILFLSILTILIELRTIMVIRY